MKKENKLYITAAELSEMLGISIGYSYKLIRQMNISLKETNPNCLILSGKIPRRYFEQCWYGYGA